MYSPKIKEEHIPVLYQLGKKRKRPMTVVVNELLEEALAKQQESVDSETEQNQKGGLK